MKIILYLVFIIDIAVTIILLAFLFSNLHFTILERSCIAYATGALIFRCLAALKHTGLAAEVIAKTKDW